MSAIAVIDFETTGLSPGQGARATEIAAVRIEDGRIVDRYQSLMYTGAWLPPFIEQLTGISQRMLESAPPAVEVMREVTAFTQGCAMVAHNAGFDRGFWRHEQQLAGCAPEDLPEEQDSEAGSKTGTSTRSDAGNFACTMLLSRRLYPEAPNHRLGTLVSWHGIEPAGRAHRALADAEMAAQLWLRIVRDVERRYAADVSHGLLCAMQAASRAQLQRCVDRYFAATSSPGPEPFARDPAQPTRAGRPARRRPAPADGSRAAPAARPGARPHADGWNDLE